MGFLLGLYLGIGATLAYINLMVDQYEGSKEDRAIVYTGVVVTLFAWLPIQIYLDFAGRDNE
tara:strand:+ start:368 stop:553 length:186 start_codon:yes stop_codon:yes gene_type:complete